MLIRNLSLFVVSSPPPSPYAIFYNQTQVSDLHRRALSASFFIHYLLIFILRSYSQASSSAGSYNQPQASYLRALSASFFIHKLLILICNIIFICRVLYASLSSSVGSYPQASSTGSFRHLQSSLSKSVIHITRITINHVTD
jgi:hypothetical protein